LRHRRAIFSGDPPKWTANGLPSRMSCPATTTETTKRADPTRAAL